MADPYTLDTGGGAADWRAVAAAVCSAGKQALCHSLYAKVTSDTLVGRPGGAPRCQPISQGDRASVSLPEGWDP